MTDDTTIEQTISKSLMKDRRADRRWRNIRWIGWMVILIIYAILIFAPKSTSSTTSSNDGKPYVSLIRLNGMIAPNTSFSAQRVIPRLIKAFKDKQSKGVVLLINSPGGTPVQASIIHDKIEQLKKKYHKKVVVVGEDVLASGAYLVSTAADKIFVNKDTVTGSIGVIMSGFGLTDAIQKLGITRRVFTAGTNKDRLDPFKPVTATDKEKIDSILNAVHQSFIEDVIKGRGNRLHGNRQALFSGDFWTGQQAAKLGLVDGTANLWTVLKIQFNVEHYKDYSVKPTFFQTIFKDINTKLNLGLMKHGPKLQEVLN